MPTKLRRENLAFSDGKNPPQHAYSCAALLTNAVNGTSTEVDAVEVSDTVPDVNWGILTFRVVLNCTCR